MSRPPKRAVIVLFALGLFMVSCGGGAAPATDQEVPPGPASSNHNASLNKDDYPVFPDADAGADAAVPAEQGGRGFKGEGWETDTGFELIGDPRAVKGGTLRSWTDDFPGTLRVEGPESNSAFNYGVTAMAYESLVGIHPTTMAFMPSLASHWQIAADKMTFRFRLNPNARFSDGMPVTADDVVATFKFKMDKTLQSPTNQITFGKLEVPVAESRYLVRVHAKELNWRNFLYFGIMPIFPAHVLNAVNGEQYLKDFNFKIMPGSGPYTIRAEDIVKGKSIAARRRPDYWAAKARASTGMYNFDELRFVVIRDENLAFEIFKKGELDVFAVGRAKQWVEETDFDSIKRGLVQKRKIFNSQAWGFSGFAMNTARPPFDDIRVRKAFTLLTDRKTMIEKLAYNEYIPLNSYFPSSVYENPDNPRNPYDPKAAAQLLSEAGWNSRDSRGRLTRNGQPLEVEMLYSTKTFEKYLTIYQEDLRSIGIGLNLRLITPEAQFKLVSERGYQMTYWGWGGLLFPNPETSFHSNLAAAASSSNITAFKNPRVDELCKQYDAMFDTAARIRAIREIDAIVANDYDYVLLWQGPYTRLLYWSKFGAPTGYLSRTGDALGNARPDSGGPGIMQLWWVDPAKQGKLDAALRDPAVKLEAGPVEDRYWIEFDKKQTGKEQAK